MGICFSTRKLHSSTTNSGEKGLQEETSLSNTRLTRAHHMRRVKALDRRIHALHTSEANDATISNPKKSSNDITLITSALNRHFVFSTIMEDHRNEVIDKMLLY